VGKNIILLNGTDSALPPTRSGKQKERKAHSDTKRSHLTIFLGSSRRNRDPAARRIKSMMATVAMVKMVRRRECWPPRRRRRGRGTPERLRRRRAAAPPGLLEREGDVGDGEELLHVDHGHPVVAALLHGGGDDVVLARVADGAEVDEEEVDDGVGGRELAAQPGDEAVALVHDPAGGLGRGGGGGDDGSGGHCHRGPAVIERRSPASNARGAGRSRVLLYIFRPRSLCSCLRCGGAGLGRTELRGKGAVSGSSTCNRVRREEGDVKRRRGGSGRGRFAKLEAGGRRTRSPADAWVLDLPVSVKAREWRGRPWGFALRCANTECRGH
jgi:hypothetical protein